LSPVSHYKPIVRREKINETINEAGILVKKVHDSFNRFCQINAKVDQW
jgi:hypothetical protein